MKKIAFMAFLIAAIAWIESEIAECQDSHTDTCVEREQQLLCRIDDAHCEEGEKR